ncbi:MAG: hypothetical protein R3E60_02620 [Alphaproteobacteria bacterium]
MRASAHRQLDAGAGRRQNSDADRALGHRSCNHADGLLERGIYEPAPVTTQCARRLDAGIEDKPQ